MIRYLIALLMVSTVCQSPAIWADDGAAKEIPELQVLSNYVGTWDVAITSADSSFTKGEVTATWILDGRFVQQTGALTSADAAAVLKITTLMTYDQNQKAYRMWSFVSNGSTSESSGKWDATKRTMTSINRRGGETSTTTAKFSDNGKEEWTIVTTNQNNEILGRFGGTNTRRK
jgi:hypothetical protein